MFPRQIELVVPFFLMMMATYALYLDERLECFRVLKYDVETDPLCTQVR